LKQKFKKFQRGVTTPTRHTMAFEKSTDDENNITAANAKQYNKYLYVTEEHSRAV